MKIYFNAMTGSTRDSNTACKIALDAIKEDQAEAPDFSRTMQAIIYNVFYPEDPNKPQIVEKGELSTDIIDISHDSQSLEKER